jgi:hypothetical protein
MATIIKSYYDQLWSYSNIWIERGETMATIIRSRGQLVYSTGMLRKEKNRDNGINVTSPLPNPTLGEVTRKSQTAHRSKSTAL